MSFISLHRHIDRDNRRRDRIAAGSVMARYVRRADISYVGRSLLIHDAFVKQQRASIPEGVVVIAVRRAGARIHPLLIEAFEGDAAGFASFPRLAYMLGSTELQFVTKPNTMLERIRVVEDLSDKAQFNRTALLGRPLVVAGAFDRTSIMATACAIAKARRSVTCEAWGVCLSAALKGVWTLAKATRLAVAH